VYRSQEKLKWPGPPLHPHFYSHARRASLHLRILHTTVQSTSDCRRSLGGLASAFVSPPPEQPYSSVDSLPRVTAPPFVRCTPTHSFPSLDYKTPRLLHTPTFSTPAIITSCGFPLQTTNNTQQTSHRISRSCNGQHRHPTSLPFRRNSNNFHHLNSPDFRRPSTGPCLFRITNDLPP
jgi:hypothetical protein